MPVHKYNCNKRLQHCRRLFLFIKHQNVRKICIFATKLTQTTLSTRFNMITLTQRLHYISCRDRRAYFIAALFVIGNILLPQVFHCIPGGGAKFLPILFFTLIAAYKYGWQVGLLTAVLSPVANHLLFGMPELDVLPIISLKSMCLALCAGYAALKFRRVSIPLLFCVVMTYQGIGLIFEWIISCNIYPSSG